MNEIRIIKKYPNRRLYDTMLSCYITLEDVKVLVQNRVPLQIIEARTKKDITHSTLIYLLVEQENSETPLFTAPLLENLIRLNADANSEQHGKGIYQFVTQTLASTVCFLSEQVECLLLENPSVQEMDHFLELIAALKQRPLISTKKISAKTS